MRKICGNLKYEARVMAAVQRRHSPLRCFIPSAKRHMVRVSALCVQFLVCASLLAQCKPGAPVGHFEGSATSAQAGKLDVSLNLLCESGSYAGELNTPLGVYKVTTGSFEAGTNDDPGYLGWATDWRKTKQLPGAEGIHSAELPSRCPLFHAILQIRGGPRECCRAGQGDHSHLGRV